MRMATRTCKWNITGWSCKDLSTCNSSVKNKQGVMSSGSGSTGSTFAGLLSFLDECDTIGVWIGENVLEMSRLSSENRAELYNAMTPRGWVLQTRFLQGMDYGCLASRGRTWIIAIHAERVGLSRDDAHDRLTAVWELIEGLTISPNTFTATDFLLDDSCDYVKAAANALRLDPPVDPSETLWQKQFAELLTDKGLLWSQCCVSSSESHGAMVARAATPRAQQFWLHEVHTTLCRVRRCITDDRQRLC